MSKEITPKEFELIGDYFTLKSLREEGDKPVLDFLNYQGLDISREGLNEYFSELEGKISSLIGGNEEARKFYCRMENPKSFNEKIDELFNYKDEKNLEKKFVEVLKQVYDAVMKTNLNVYHNDYSVSKRDKSPYISLRKLIQHSYTNTTEFYLINNGKKVMIESYLSEDYSYLKNWPRESTKELFNDYWRDLIRGNEEAGVQIRNIIGLEEKVNEHLSQRLNKIRNIFENGR